MVTCVTPARRRAGRRVHTRPRWTAWPPLAAFAVVAGLWVAVHRVSGFGPGFADALRAVIGIHAVAELEHLAYDLADRLNQALRRGERPRARWAVPRAEPAEVTTLPTPAPLAPRVEVPAAPAPRFRPRDVGPVHAGWSAPGDGVWVPFGVAPSAGGDPLMYKTLLHPDPERSWTELYVAAIDLERVELRYVPGTREPVAVPDAPALERPGLVPAEHQPCLLAAFNGGFKTEHGHHGVRVSGVTLVPPRARSCTIAYYPDGSLRIAPWSKLAPTLPEMAWLRQTPPCLYDDGVLHPRLASGYQHGWGSSLEGKTVIRRSALGVDSDGKTLFVALGEHTSAEAIARGLHHAGASNIAQLDINHAFPKLLAYSWSAGELVATPLAEGFEHAPGEYVHRPSGRDFFYLLPAASARCTAAG